jgi:hypothetical protein
VIKPRLERDGEINGIIDKYVKVKSEDFDREMNRRVRMRKEVFKDTMIIVKE